MNAEQTPAQTPRIPVAVEVDSRPPVGKQEEGFLSRSITKDMRGRWFGISRMELRASGLWNESC